MKVLVAEQRPETSGTLKKSSQAQPKFGQTSNDLVTDFEPLLSCWEALDGRIRLILSRKGQIIARSAGAEQCFEHGEGMDFTNILALVCAPPAGNRLQRIFGVEVGKVEAVTLPKRSGDWHYLLCATGINAVAIAVAMRDADGAFVTVLADLEEAFGLTRCEVLVLEKLMHGLVPQQIADEFAISVHTVRAHLRHCYDKLEVSSREELWQRLAPYRLN